MGWSKAFNKRWRQREREEADYRSIDASIKNFFKKEKAKSKKEEAKRERKLATGQCVGQTLFKKGRGQEREEGDHRSMHWSKA